MSQMSAWLAEAVAFHNAGRLDEAERIYKNVLRLDPRNADALHCLGLIALSRGDTAVALDTIRKAIAIKAKAGVFHFNLGIALRKANDINGAIESYRRAIKLSPALAQAHNNLGTALRDLGRVAEGVESVRRAVAIRPDYAEAHLNLSMMLLALGRVDEAEAAVRTTVRLAPALPQAYHQLADVLQHRGLLEESLATYRRALELRPDMPEAILNLGNVLQRLGRAEEALAVLQQLHARLPNSAEVLNNLGNAYLNLGRRAEAIIAFEKALSINPNLVHALNNLGVTFQQEGRLDEAVAFCRRALAVRPDPDAHNNLGLALPAFGEYAEARRNFLQAVELQPGFIAGYRNLMAAMLYAPDMSEEERWGVAREFEARFAPAASAPPAPFANVRERDRPIVVGYVSSDFYEHPVGRNLEPVLASRDRERTKVICYAEVGKPDATTARYQAMVDGWRSTVGLSDAQVAEQIRRDQVDVLVVLAGRFDHNRPLIASYRPAPVQVSFHDPATSGLAAMDYLIADRTLVPRRPSERFTERVVRLPSFYIHAPLEGAPDVAPLPASSRGYVTFASFNNPAKISPQVLALWAEVLRAIPGSRLKLKCKNWFANENLRGRFLAQLDIAPERIEFDVEDRRIVQHLALYGDADIALDPFPFTGSTTTFESLWMGVPVLTLLGETMVGRWSASMLHALGLDEWIARTPEDYVRKAIALAGDPAKLAGLRSELRQRVAASPLCDGKLRARQMDRIYRALWRRWCAHP